MCPVTKAQQALLFSQNIDVYKNNLIIGIPPLQRMKTNRCDFLEYLDVLDGLEVLDALDGRVLESKEKRKEWH